MCLGDDAHAPYAPLSILKPVSSDVWIVDGPSGSGIAARSCALLRLASTADPDGKMPLDMQSSFLRQRKALRSAVQRMMAWEPERIIIAHGRWYEGNAVAELRRAFRWVL